MASIWLGGTAFRSEAAPPTAIDFGREVVIDILQDPDPADPLAKLF